MVSLGRGGGSAGFGSGTVGVSAAGSTGTGDGAGVGGGAAGGGVRTGMDNFWRGVSVGEVGATTVGVGGGGGEIFVTGTEISGSSAKAAFFTGSGMVLDDRLGAGTSATGVSTAGTPGGLAGDDATLPSCGSGVTGASLALRLAAIRSQIFSPAKRTIRPTMT